MSWQTGSAPAADPDPEAPGTGPLLAIAEVEQETGLSARTLRYYEELGLLPGVRRRAGGRRVYDAEQLERIRFIQRLKKLGLSLAEIKELNAVYAIGGSTRAMLARLGELLDGHAREVTRRIEELRALRREIDRYREHIGRRIDRTDRIERTDGEAR